MNFEELASFTTALSGIDKSSGYITEKNGRFLVVDSKDNKLNTVAIEQKAKQALALLKETHLNCRQATLWYSDMAKGLKAYIHRVYRHKNFLEKICWWFGISSKAERALYRDYTDCVQKAAYFGSVQQQIQHKIQHDTILPLSLSKRDELALAYMSIMDASRLNIPSLSGMKASVAASWMLTHLQNFHNTLAKDHPDREKVQNAIGKMQYAATIAEVEDLVVISPNPELKNWLTQALLSSVVALKPGESFAFNGGYSQTNAASQHVGHSVQYRFVANTDGTVTLTFLNSGEGAEMSALKRQEKLKPKQTFWERLMDIFFEEGDTLKDNLLESRVVDDTWKHIPQHALNTEFIEVLLKYRITKTPTNMTIIRQEVSAFLKRYGVRYETSKSAHKAQRKGNCTVKSLALWMRLELGTSLWHSFKSYYTNREAEKLDSLLASMPVVDRAYFMRDVVKVQKKRSAKTS